MMAGILIVYICVIISWEITCVIINLGGTRASVAFFDALDEELGTLSPAHRAFVRVEKAVTHVSNLDWRRPNVWSTSEVQIQSVSQSVKKTGLFFRRFFQEVAIPRCRSHGIAEPRAPSFFGTLVQDNLRARYVQDISSFEYSVRLEELGDFYKNQRWRHMHDVLRSRDINYHELGHRGLEAAVAILKDEGFTREEALREIGHRRRRGALASLEVQGLTEEGAASTELGHRGCDGALDSLEAQGFTEEGEASFELSRRGGVACLAIYRISGNCAYPGCTYAIYSGEFCKNHNPAKPAKSGKCRVCGWVFVAKERVTGGVCMPCYKKPEAIAARKKATVEKKAARGTCSTLGCKGIKDRSCNKCSGCYYH
jgi:hypothetical protein